MFNHHPPYSPDLALSGFHIFLLLNKFLSGQRRRFEKDRGGNECHTMVTIPNGTGYKRWSQGMTNVLIPQVNMLENSSILAVSVPINPSIKLGFVSVNGLRETYFMDALRRFRFI